MAQIAICHPTDPLGHVPGGIDTIIRGVMDFAPPDLSYTLFGASSDTRERPLRRPVNLGPGPNGGGRCFVPLASADPQARRSHVPLTLRFLAGLWQQKRRGELRAFDALDFHRVEPLLLFRGDRRPKNIVIHQDMTVIRDPSCDILWRHAPWLYERIEPWLLRTTARVFTVRERAAQRYAAAYPELAERVAFLPTWFDSRVFLPSADDAARHEVRSQLRAAFGIAQDAPVIITVGRLDKQKDPLLLLSAFAGVRRAHPNLHLLFIGDGVLRPDIAREGARSGLTGCVHFGGVMPPARIAAALRGADLFVLSSAYEGMPIAVLEALATGLPVVTTDVGEVRRVVVPGRSGAIATQRTTEALAAAMNTALQGLPGMRGLPAAEAVAPFAAANVLQVIYDTHRSEAAHMPRGSVTASV